jgi:hypothetical protein
MEETADGVAPTIVGAHGGAQSSTGDLAPDLVPPEALLAISAVVGAGSKKYARGNWRKIPANEQIRHALTHIFKYMMGDRSERHLWNALTRLAFAVAVEDEAYDYRGFEPLPERLTKPEMPTIFFVSSDGRKSGKKVVGRRRTQKR